MDDTNAASFIAFGKQAKKLVGVDVGALIRIMEERGGDPNEYPAELDGLIDKKFLFKVNVKHNNIDDPENSTYSILTVCNDSAITDSFIKKYQLDEQVNTTSPHASVDDSSSVCMLSSKENESLTVSKDSIFDSSAVEITPIKRSLDFSLDSQEDENTPMHSTTVLLKKIKQEKME
ncbi:PREDICTED: uncharacterized protein LOC105953424 [Erythranthe guttata]|uniref:uncharacterized protein LOC105953424 n=1 Tax=Erythranthe guttata TaxID=4155 RepID=UPI00064DA2AC|nr:PREDICTED: uncharacterized protein LOC105953424 [Erythranthe guttata]|eukprot:XP_012832538.1 PREDICTED: uncharacterized protein LOC105953424 [Erythranthe guttata]